MSSSTPRFPATSLTPAQRADLGAAEQAVRSTFGTAIELRDANGTLLGPFGPLSYTPSVLSPYLTHMVAVNTTPLLMPRERELSRAGHNERDARQIYLLRAQEDWDDSRVVGRAVY
ncbi:hypothetical protein BU23DRAFT_602117 [Bimuria novae-zelandiae CBS 107.79]|uniref:Uncharacterized protein n=1 Tax=Bimuria novae-zelandiae CBS 107.79 TaxID=1447943 RepID=A0A6A5UXG6_9PLEO|nr:hypothetical protein BU23DRAFT_602117 [Bimuria novae-zelandiae CBS 107.79]